jgi:hypothetical protein
MGGFRALRRARRASLRTVDLGERGSPQKRGKQRRSGMARACLRKALVKARQKTRCGIGDGEWDAGHQPRCLLEGEEEVKEGGSVFICRTLP